ncbi:hypothetical protein MTR67_051810 [Solanum verrucosum]|uniref:AAA+ ATPase At3g28540-like C-terminal domain-containing protein n=1 Tax=Solanum verrucosum TaxID=315347 RepID=A0AAF0V5U5_SOLVR|nr:hypothetical protein MTR67_051810 [Solanum verrucosum]
MEIEKKQEIVDDLLMFRESKDFYARIGKAWKRGYLLYGPSGTAVRDNTELRRLLAETTSKSIIVIEDIDCSLDLTGQRKKKPPEEKIEKTKKEVSRKDTEESGRENYVDKLDPALTRRGRMDKHIELSYCSFDGFKVLAKNYLRLDTHPIFESIEILMRETKIIPADVAENLMPSSPKEDAEKCLLKLVKALKQAKQLMIKKEEESALSEL